MLSCEQVKEKNRYFVWSRAHRLYSRRCDESRWQQLCSAVYVPLRSPASPFDAVNALTASGSISVIACLINLFGWLALRTPSAQRPSHNRVYSRWPFEQYVHFTARRNKLLYSNERVLCVSLRAKTRRISEPRITVYVALRARRESQVRMADLRDLKLSLFTVLRRSSDSISHFVPVDPANGFLLIYRGDKCRIF